MGGYSATQARRYTCYNYTSPSTTVASAALATDDAVVEIASTVVVTVTRVGEGALARRTLVGTLPCVAD